MPEQKKENQITGNQPAKKKDFSFFYDVAKLVTGNGFVQALRAILSPIISRLYLPAFFGITQNFSSVANILAVLSSLRYDQTILLPKEEEKAANLLGLSLLLTAITTPFSLLFVALFRNDLANLLNAPALATYLWFVPLQVLAIGLFNILRQWAARKKHFFRLSAAQVVNEVAADGLTAGFGFADLASGSTMILSRITGQLMGSLTLGLLVIREDGKFIFDNLRWKQMWAGMKEYRKFPQFNIWASLLSTFALYIPGVILSAYFSPTIAGYFAYGQSVLRLPVALVGNSIGQVLFQRGAKAYHEGKLRATVEEAFKRLVVFGMFPMLVLMLIGEPLFATVFGVEWAEAGAYSQILSIWTLSIFIANPLGTLTDILHRNEVSVALNLVKVITGIGSLVIGGITGNIYLGLWLFTITGTLSYGWLIFWATGASGIPIRRSLKYIVDNLALCAPFLAAIFVFEKFNPLPDRKITALDLSLQNLGLIAFSIMIGVIYYIIVVLRDTSIRAAMQQIIDKRRK
jgi:O-antigen/teichoic acid export membrane protein